MAPGSAEHPSLPQLLDALREHLLPSPRLRTLPTALQIFAHFQLLSARIKSEALRALAVQDELIAQLEGQDVPVEDWCDHGALRRDEGKRLRRWAKRDEGDEMFGYSLEIRKHHLARVLSSPSAPLDGAFRLLQSYFPDVSRGDSAAQAGHAMLFIRCMTPEQAATMRYYRGTVIKWYNDAKADEAASRGRLVLDTLIADPAGKLEMLAVKIVKEAERVYREAGDFHAMFEDPDSECSESGEGVAEIKRSPSTDRLVPLQDMSTRAQKAERRRTLSALQPVLQSDVSTARPRASLPVTLGPRARSRSSSPSPEHVATLPRVSFDLTSGRAKARMSVEYTPTLQTPSPRPPANVMMAHAHDGHAHESSTSSPPVVLTQAHRPAGHASAPRTSAQPRRSFGADGPDYTAPLAKGGSGLDKAQLRPFDRSQLSHKRKSAHVELEGSRVKRRNEEDLRMAQPGARQRGEVKIDGEASGPYPAASRDKGKGRAAPKGVSSR